MIVSFGIDADNATPEHRARLVDAGMSMRVIRDNGVEVGPMFPVPHPWLQASGGIAYFRGPVTFRYWNGLPGWYDSVILRVAPTREHRQFVEPTGLVAVLHFRPVLLGNGAAEAMIELPNLRVA